MSLNVPEVETLSSLVGLLQLRMQTQPHETAFIFLQDGDADAVSLTYQALHNTACLIAGYLQKDLQAGDRALLIYPSGLEFICAFFGCLYAGVLPVPVQAPRANRGFSQLNGIIHNSKPGIILTDANLQLFVASNLPALPVIATNALDTNYGGYWQAPLIHEADPAFLQYTSGSTGAPKGVIVSHRNVLHNQSLIKKAFRHDENSIIVGWLPFYHDMGLIGNMLQPIYLGRPCIFMQPITFIQNPFLWLQAISDYKATTSGGPSFAYELCLRKITPDQLSNLDLQSWQVAFNGSEPVRSEVINQFAAYFSPANFKKSAFFPCYGMAEATLFITGSNSTDRPVIKHVKQAPLAKHVVEFCSQDDDKSIAIVGCGQSTDQTLEIVSPSTLTKCAANEVGEIWVSGRSIAQGYWHNVEATTRDFHAQIIGHNDQHYLRTGDLGFFHDNELFITGRLKDLIIIRGRNYYAHDIEKLVEKSHPALRPTCGAAFSIEVENEEKLVIVQEVEREHIRRLDDKAVILAIRQSIADHFDLNIHALVLLRTGQVPKTSSGKIKRRACKQKYIENTFEIVASSGVEPLREAIKNEAASVPSNIQAFFLDVAAELLRVEKNTIDMDRPLIHYGVDSIIAADFQTRLEASLDIRWSVTRFLQGESLAQLAFAASQEPRLPEPEIQKTASSELRLLPTQAGMYFLYQYAPENTVNNIYFAARVQQALNFKAWDAVWKKLIERHVLLRTTYHTEQGQTLQKVHEVIQNPLQYESHLHIDEASLRALLATEANKPFMLEKQPPFRLYLYQISPKEYVFLFSAHHIACDLQSILILMREFSCLYQHWLSETPLSLPLLQCSYEEYAHRQLIPFDTELRQGERQYWTQKLAGELPILNLPTKGRRPPMQSFHGAFVEFDIDRSLSDKLQALAKRQDMTLYMVLMAAYQLLLYRYTQQDDILVGSPVSGRHRRETQNLVGCFINTIVVRSKFAPSLSFLDLLAQTRQTILEAFEHQEYPFHQLVAELPIQRDISRPPIFQAMLVLQNVRLMEEAISFLFNQDKKLLDLGGIPLQCFPLDKQTVLYDVTLVMAAAPEGMLGRLEYNSDLFDATSMEGFLRHFKNLLEEIVRDPSQAIDTIPLLSVSEEQHILTNFSHAQITEEGVADFMTAFIRQVEQCPQAIAAEFNHEQLSYQELHRRSNQLANYLQSQGVGPDVLVGVFLDRSLDMLTTLLGILKAGGAYLPLDPNYPMQRLAYMIDDAGLSLLITQNAVFHKIPSTDVRVLNIDELSELINQQPQHQPLMQAPSRLAYVIYTSGSTGKPKGVLIQYDSLNNFLNAMRKLFALTCDDKWLAVTTISFDIAILELFLPLMTGAAVIIAESQATYNADKLIQLIEKSSVTVMQATPSTWQMLIARGWFGYQNFKALIGGEVLSPVLANKLQQGGCLIWNLYGPTENTVWTTAYAVGEINQDKFGHVESIPIGKPLENVQTYILDRHLKLVPVGVAGELYIGGMGVSRGYLNQPDLTECKFIPNPFLSHSTGSLYATGDAVRYLPDGNIDYLGRMDRQVKLRGYRIELEEIENALLSHDLVADGCVILHPGNDDEGGCLVAYLVTREPISTTILQEYLTERLPAYMVPAFFEYLPALPRTENNKINRKTLLSLDLVKKSVKNNFIAPRTEAEIMLASIWSEYLNVPQIGIHDNFFYLGGHSLLALRVANKLIEQHAIHLPLHVFFENQTLEKLAAEVTKQMQGLRKDTAAIIDKIKKLSAEEVKQLLEAKRLANDRKTEKL